MVLRDVDILEERLNSETDRPNKKNIIECAKLQAERGVGGAWSMAHRAWGSKSTFIVFSFKF